VPYLGLAMIALLLMTLMAIGVFGVPLRGSVGALVLGTLIYVMATTGYGMVISAFARTQIAALFGTAILTVLCATQFSGMMTPVSSLTGLGAVLGRLFPMTYFLPVSVGVFTKSLGLAELAPTMAELALFVPAFVILTACLTRAQER
jgi:ribosome-dependent ATPase